LTIPGVADLVDGKMKIDELQDVNIEELLGRDPVTPLPGLLGANITQKVVMVTGAGGSIGSELCRQILQQSPAVLIMFELSEFSLYEIDKELSQKAVVRNRAVQLVPVIGSVQDLERLTQVMSVYQVQTLYHAAAYKHVPLVEFNVIEAVRNNILGTWHTAEAAIATGVSNFVLISTDKAVRPTNVMGTTKRIAELVLQGLALRQQQTRFCMVRFGNVLGSSGSVVPLFRKQIKAGGPITLTHEDITRYFMTIPEASQLVIQAGALGKGGDVFVLDMGEPVRIYDLAVKMIHLMGLHPKTKANPQGDIEIKVTGLRPGEKLYEELLIGEGECATPHPRIKTANELFLPWLQVRKLLDEFVGASNESNLIKIRELMLSAPTGFNPTDSICDLVWKKQQQMLQVKEAKAIHS
jgi:FlaA1/EpsC-like NDP-sugar epimerase